MKLILTQCGRRSFACDVHLVQPSKLRRRAKHQDGRRQIRWWSLCCCRRWWSWRPSRGQKTDSQVALICIQLAGPNECNASNSIESNRKCRCLLGAPIGVAAAAADVGPGRRLIERQGGHCGPLKLRRNPKRATKLKK